MHVNGGGGHQPKFKHDYTENVINLGWRGRGSAWKILKKKTLDGWGSKIFCNPTPMYDIKGNSPDQFFLSTSTDN